MAKHASTGFACVCGKLRGHVRDLSPGTAVHLRCLCGDCRAAEIFLDQPDPNPDGVDLAQLDPAAVVFDGGAEHLALLRLSPTGALRWYAACCSSPMFITVASPKVAVATIRVPRLDAPERVGPVRARAFIPRPGGRHRHEHIGRLVWPVLTRSLARLLDGRWRETPFFDAATRKPVCKARVLSPAERRAIDV